MKIATRASALALAQARQVADLLGGAELLPLTTSGDRDAAAGGGGSAGDGGVTDPVPDPGAGDKSRWVAELEQALLEGRADLAVHSAKDVPALVADGLELVGSPPRADPRDALCGVASLDALEAGARVGTSSLRRVAQLRARRPDLEIAALRGNVDTRLRRLSGGAFAAIVIAHAGLQRLGRVQEAGALLDPAAFVPAPGQGTLALEARRQDESVRERVRAIADPATEACLAAERALVRALGADCHTPVGALAVSGPGGSLTLSAFVGRTDGSAWVSDRREGAEPERLGAEVAERVLAAGARELLAEEIAGAR
ncbi:MAG: hydroxymethylbilane synthase [Actinobacteria bacterium]|nr:MAG: hydroxymethylbilane synthase [Actinomycetota bacterium]